MNLDACIAAARATTGAVPASTVGHTRDRILESLRTSRRARRRTLAATIMGFLLGTGTLSFAWVHGDVAGTWHMRYVVPQVPRTSLAPVSTPVDPVPVPVPVPVPDSESPPAPGAVPPPTPPRRHARPTPDGRALYRRAHDLHFRGNDPAAAVAAFDAYLRAFPDGALATEARYDRALDLIRVGREPEALSALWPFARGEVTPAGYRQREAAALVAALVERI